MYILEKIKKNIVDTINKNLKTDITVADLSYPPNPELGDLSLPLFGVAKKLGKSPNEAGDMIISKIKPGEIINTLRIAGPYINFFINKDFLAKNAILNIQEHGGNYGRNKKGKNKKVLIEFSSVNTHKQYHVGHLRNICYGDAVTKILSANGYKAKPISYVNDFGIHVAKTLANYNNFVEKISEKKMSDNEKGLLLGQIYVDAVAREKEDEIFKQMIGGFMKKIESRSGEEYKLWQKTRQWSIKYFDEVYKKLGIKFEDILYENDYVDKGFKLVKNLIKKGILKESNGAIIADLEKYDLGVLVVVRSDGTATYPIADLALAEGKRKKFKMDESIYVVDDRQSLYFKQLFKILELAGHKENLIHLSHDFVKLTTGMMASRSGNVIIFDDLYEELIKRASNEIEKRHDDWSADKIKKTAIAIGIGAIKFEMIKVDAKNIITFDTDKALSFEGFTSSYLQYTYARIQSIFKKHHNYKFKLAGSDLEKLDKKEELELLKKLIKYPETVTEAGRKYDPSEIAKYLFELAKLFNDYYHKTSILNSKEDEKKARLALLSAVSQVLRNGLELLGIKIINEM